MSCTNLGLPTTRPSHYCDNTRCSGYDRCFCGGDPVLRCPTAGLADPIRFIKNDRYRRCPMMIPFGFSMVCTCPGLP